MCSNTCFECPFFFIFLCFAFLLGRWREGGREGRSGHDSVFASLCLGIFVCILVGEEEGSGICVLYFFVFACVVVVFVCFCTFVFHFCFCMFFLCVFVLFFSFLMFLVLAFLFRKKPGHRTSSVCKWSLSVCILRTVFGTPVVPANRSFDWRKLITIPYVIFNFTWWSASPASVTGAAAPTAP